MESSSNQPFPQLGGPSRKQHRNTSRRCFIAGDVAMVSSFGSLTSDTEEAVLNLRRQYPPIYRICRGIELSQELKNG